MDMNWEAIGAIGEILGALAVVTSLIYLALQIKVQNREARIASVHELTEAHRAILSPLHDPEIADLYLEATDNFDNLTLSKRLRYMLVMLNVYRVYQEAFYQVQKDRLDDYIWEGMLIQLTDYIGTDGAKKFWALRKHQFSPDFRSFVDNLEAAVISCSYSD